MVRRKSVGKTEDGKKIEAFFFRKSFGSLGLPKK